MWLIPKKFVFIYFCVSSVSSYKILGVFPSLDRSDYAVYSQLFRELAIRNHDVTLITNFPMLDPPASYSEILLSDDHTIKPISFESIIWSDFIRLPFESLVTTKIGNENCKKVLSNSDVQSIIRNRQKYDVIIVEQVNSDCTLALGYNLSSPVIGLAPKNLPAWSYSRLGINFNPSSTPHPELDFGLDANILQRFKSHLLNQISNFVHYIGSQITDHVFLYKYLGGDLPSLETIAENMSLVLVNRHSVVFNGLSKPDNVIDIGGIHITSPRAIPTELERFINEAEHGVVYVSLGTIVQESSLPKDKIKTLMSFFAALPFRVLWKWNENNIYETIPRNVMIRKWLPQYDILRHSNIKAFISHGGILSVMESIDAGVPMMVIPLFGDQYGNAAAVQQSKLGVIVNYHDITVATLYDAISKIVRPRFQEKAKELSRKFHDRHLSPMETAIYWIEYVARYRGAEHLKSAHTTLSWYKQSQLDIAIIYLIILYCIYKVLSKLFECMYSCCCTREDEDIFAASRRSSRLKFD